MFALNLFWSHLSKHPSLLSFTKAYESFTDESDLCKVADYEDIKKNSFSLAINRYVEHADGIEVEEDVETLSEEWLARSEELKSSIELFNEKLGGNCNESC